jgi:hypothetical protein
MRTNKILVATIAALGALASPLTHAGSGTCSTSGCAVGPLGVSFSVSIPAVLRFELGGAGTPSVTWSAGTITAGVLGDGTNVAADTTTGGALAVGGPAVNGTNEVAYRLFSNLGGTNVTIGATGVGGNLTSGGNNMPYSEIISTATGTTGGAINMPAAGGSTPVTPTGGLIIREGRWAYSFDNTALYPSGTYTGTINYTATHTP